jgi:hypothetical protein
MKYNLLFFLLFASPAALACLDQTKLKTAFENNVRTTSAMEIRTSFLEDACGLDDLEVLTRPDWDITPGTEAFPTYSRALSSFIATHVSKVPLPEALSDRREAIAKMASRLVGIEDQLEFRYSLLEAAARTCDDLVVLTSVGT